MTLKVKAVERLLNLPSQAAGMMSLMAIKPWGFLDEPSGKAERLNVKKRK